MLYQRRISRIYNVPPLAPGFVGLGHLAAPVISPEEFALNDPFILLMDDHFDIGDRPVGGPHPHAGFETVTLLLQGSVYDRDEGGLIKAGEVQWMTAGRGIIHGENVGAKGKVRLLQLWLTLPKADRWTEPGFQTIHTDAVPVRRENGAEVRIYSGGSGSLPSKTRNHVPATITEITGSPCGCPAEKTSRAPSSPAVTRNKLAPSTFGRSSHPDCPVLRDVASAPTWMRDSVIERS